METNIFISTFEQISWIRSQCESVWVPFFFFFSVYMSILWLNFRMWILLPTTTSTVQLKQPVLLSRCCRSTTTYACGSPARTTWSVSRCWSLTARLPSSPPRRSCSGPFTPSTACAAAARWASRATIARLRWTSAIRGRARTTAAAAAGRGATPANAWRTSRVGFSLAVEAQKSDLSSWTRFEPCGLQFIAHRRRCVLLSSRFSYQISLVEIQWCFFKWCLANSAPSNNNWPKVLQVKNYCKIR